MVIDNRMQNQLFQEANLPNSLGPHGRHGSLMEIPTRMTKHHAVSSGSHDPSVGHPNLVDFLDSRSSTAQPVATFAQLPRISDALPPASQNNGGLAMAQN